MKVTIVIPTYNEAENLPKITQAIFAQGVPDISLLVVDDNSPDGTGQLAEELGRQHGGKVEVMHRSGKLGLGTAYIQGFKQAIARGSDVIGQMDADFSHPVEKIPVLISTLAGYDMVLGSRYVPGGRLDDNWPFWRKALSGFGNFYARTILNMRLRDVTGGYRFWKRETLAGMPLDRVKSNGYVFQVEMAYVASLLGYKFHEIPIYFADRRWGQSKMSLRIQIEAAFRVWQLLPMYQDLRRGIILE